MGSSKGAPQKGRKIAAVGRVGLDGGCPWLSFLGPFSFESEGEQSVGARNNCFGNWTNALAAEWKKKVEEKVGIIKAGKMGDFEGLQSIRNY